MARVTRARIQEAEGPTIVQEEAKSDVEIERNCDCSMSKCRNRGPKSEQKEDEDPGWSKEDKESIRWGVIGDLMESRSESEEDGTTQALEDELLTALKKKKRGIWEDRLLGALQAKQ